MPLTTFRSATLARAFSQPLVSLNQREPSPRRDRVLLGSSAPLLTVPTSILQFALMLTVLGSRKKTSHTGRGELVDSRGPHG